MHEINEKCVKCGGDDADIKYHGGHTTVAEHLDLREVHSLVVGEVKFDKDILLVTCKSCDFSWTEKPLDARR